MDSYRSRVRSTSSDLGGGGALSATAAAAVAAVVSSGGGNGETHAAVSTTSASAERARTTSIAGGHNVPWSADSAAKLHEITDYRATIANAYEWMW